MLIDWQAARTKKFPANVIHYAQEAERQTGFPAAMSLAQWADESAYGAHMAGLNNPFGMKWWDGCGFPSSDVATHEVINGKSIAVKAGFISFTSLEIAFNFHAKRLMRPSGPYGSTLHLLPSDFRGWVKAVAAIYATNPSYGVDLLGIIDTYHLCDLNLPKP